MNLDLPRAFGAPALTGLMRQQAEDFRVEELDAFEPSGEGEHLLLRIEKRNLNTNDVVEKLARWAGIRSMGIGFAGMKDRVGVTVQRFTVHLPKRIAPDISALNSDKITVLEHAWHARKLPRGALKGNRFILTLRDVQGSPEALAERLQQITSRGIPNFFGEQRFGRGGANVDAALRMFAGERVKREKRSIYLSAARSHLFNEVLIARVKAGNWDRGMDGEVWMLDGSHSVFGPEPFSDELKRRLGEFDIHPTGPMWGEGELRSQGVCQELELAVLSGFSELRQGLEGARLKQERRASRIPVFELQSKWLECGNCMLTFALPSGAYATRVLAEIGDLE